MEGKKELAKKLKKLNSFVDEKGKTKRIYTYSEIAEKTELSQSLIIKLFTGDTENPKLGTLRKLADLFNVELEFFISDSKSDNKISSYENIKIKMLASEFASDEKLFKLIKLYNKLKDINKDLLLTFADKLKKSQ